MTGIETVREHASKCFTGMFNNIRLNLLEKNEYRDFLSMLDYTLSNYLKEVGEGSNNGRIPLLTKTTEQMFDNIVTLKKKAAAHPEYVSGEVVKMSNEWMRGFLKKFYLGWVEEFSYYSGYFKVKINCDISKRNTENPLWDKELFEKSLLTLANLGLELSASSTSAKIKNTSQNFLIISTFMNENGAKHVNFKTRDANIDSFDFTVSTADIVGFKVIEKEVKKKKSISIDENGILSFKKLAGEFNFALGSITCDKVSDDCKYLVRSYFSDICEIFDFHGKIYEGIIAEHKLSKENNEKIKNIGHDLATEIGVARLGEYMKTLTETLDGYMVNNLGFTAHDIFIDRYGVVNATLSYVQRDAYSAGKLIPEDALKAKFKTVGESREASDLNIVDSSKNQVNILSILLAAIPSLRIQEIKTSVRDCSFNIQDIKVYIENISEIFELTFEKDEDY